MNAVLAPVCRLINLSERGLDSDRAHVMTEGIFAISIKFYQLDLYEKQLSHQLQLMLSQKKMNANINPIFTKMLVRLLLFVASRALHGALFSPHWLPREHKALSCMGCLRCGGDGPRTGDTSVREGCAFWSQFKYQLTSYCNASAATVAACTTSCYAIATLTTLQSHAGSQSHRAALLSPPRKVSLAGFAV
jgi:hypothetical protein